MSDKYDKDDDIIGLTAGDTDIIPLTIRGVRGLRESERTQRNQKTDGLWRPPADSVDLLGTIQALQAQLLTATTRVAELEEALRLAAYQVVVMQGRKPEPKLVEQVATAFHNQAKAINKQEK